MRTHRSTLVLAALVGLAGCGEHRRTVVVPAANAAPGPGYPAQPPTTTAPASSNGTAPTPSGSVTPPAPGVTAQVAVAVTGPGPARIASDARERLALRLRLSNAGPDAAELQRLVLSASGRLDDARDIATLRLAEDRDGDGRFDRAIDRVLASAGFTQDDGQAEFRPATSIPSGATLRLLVTVDLTGSGRANDELRLGLSGASALTFTTANGGVSVTAPVARGPVLKLGGWVEPHLAFALPGDGLFPRAVRDAQGKTHVAIYQNHNGNSDVWYTVFDGRSYSPIDDISHSQGAAWNQDLAVEGGLPHVVFEQWDNAISDYAIHYTRFDANNFGWTAAEPVSSGPGTSLLPRILVAGGEVHTVWEETAPAGSPRILHRLRTAGGWGAIAEVTSATASARATKPAIARLNGEVVIAWAENDVTRSEVVTRTWTAAGFGRRVVVASAQSTVERPQLLVAGGELHLSFETGGEVFHQRRNAQGWSQATNVSRSPTSASTEPALVHHAGRIHLVWVEDETGPSGNTATQVAHAAARGGGFGPVELLTRGLGARSYPVAVSEGDRLKVLWQDWSLGRQRIFSTWREPTALEAPRAIATPGGDPQRPDVARAPDGAVLVSYGLHAGGNDEVFVQVEARPGAGFARAENVSRSATPSYKPSVAVVGSTAWIAWEEQAAGGFEVRVAHAIPTGWSQPATLSSATPAYGPRLVGGDGGPAAVWTERDAASGAHRVTTRAWTGRGWSAPERLSPDAADAWNPDAARTAAGVLAAVWEDEQAGRRRIRLAARSSTGLEVAFVASSASGQWAPRIAAAGETLHVIWVEDGRVRVASRGPGSSTFAPPTDLSAGGCWSPDIAAAGDAVVACWEQWSGGDARVMHSVLTPQGWSTPAPLDLSAGPSRRASLLGTASGGAHLVWTTPGTVWLRERRED